MTTIDKTRNGLIDSSPQNAIEMKSIDVSNFLAWKVILLIFLFHMNKVSGQEAKSTPADRPNIVWITSEDNSKHYLSLFDEHGAPTPHIAELARGGLLFTHAFANAPVCSVSRSTLITGAYGPRIGSQYHRKIRQVPMPENLKMFPEYLREAGYYTTNNHKEDYNLQKSTEVWDESSREATWKNRKPGQPFFHMVNNTMTHEGGLHFTREKMEEYEPATSVGEVFVQPNHPDTDLFRFTNAYYRDRIRQMDDWVGNILQDLKEEGLMENTIIFYFGDHGGVLPGSKGYLYETGLHVPLVVYIPPAYRETLGVEAGSQVEGFVSFIDFAPTVLELAGVEIPDGMDGVPFLGARVDMAEMNQRDEIFAYADRFDEKYDMTRSVRKGKYKYIRSFQPYEVDALMNNYRYNMLAYQEWESLYRAGELTAIQSAFFQARPPELLFDVEADPYETKNLADDPVYQEKLLELRSRLHSWIVTLPDLSLYPEYVLINQAFDNPTQFGADHRADISRYLTIANLCLDRDPRATRSLKKALRSNDPWDRYWALIACNAGDRSARIGRNLIEKIASSDPVPVNRVQAALYLALEYEKDPDQIMTEALYDAVQPAEGLLILNTIVLLQDWGDRLMSEGADPVIFHIDPAKMDTKLREAPEVQRRLQYMFNGE